MKYDNYYLDLDKINTLTSNPEKEQIHKYYMDMMYCLVDNREGIGKSIFHTLSEAGFLKEIRSEKIEKILND